MLNAFLSIRRLLVVSSNKINILCDIALPFTFAFVSANAAKLIGNIFLPQIDGISLVILMSISFLILAFLIVFSKGNIYKIFSVALGVVIPKKANGNFKREKSIEFS